MVLISPWLLAHKFRRALRGSDPADGDLNRWNGWCSHPSPSNCEGPHFVLAGACYGELLLVERFTEVLRTRHPKASVTWMLRDAALVNQVRTTRPDQPVCLWPFDFIVPVDRFLKQIRPDVLILTERFRFTNLVCGSSSFGARVILLNGRFKPIHFIARTFFGGIYRWNLNCIDLALMQSCENAERAKRYAAEPERFQVLEGIKDQLSIERAHSQMAEDLKEWLSSISDLPLFVAGSTDGPEEEAFVLSAFQKVLEQYPARLILAPRKLKRAEVVLRSVKSLGLAVGRRSANDTGGDVTILDTLGELSSVYHFAVGSYVGGFFDGMGHNILEPVICGSPVAYGTRTGHFGETQHRCEERGVGFRVASDQELANHWISLLENSDFRKQIASKASTLISEMESSWERAAEWVEQAVY